MTPPPARGGVASALRALLKPGSSLRSRAISGAALLLFREGYTNGLRLAANLIMTRLLYPEAFGLMLIVNLVMGGLEMLSDVGVRGAVIVRQGKLDEDFIETAWTMMVVRGALLTCVALALAWPLSVYYAQPQLAGLIALASAGGVISGFTSPYRLVRERNLKLGRVVVWTAAVQTVSLLLTVIWLLLYPTIWALVGHRLISALLSAASSHRVFSDRMPRLRWHRESSREIFGYGKWVFVSTALTFLARQGDSLVISKWISTSELGVFSIAASLAMMVQNVLGTVNSNLLLPVYSELRRGAADRMARGQRKIKLGVLALSIPFVLALALCGRDIIAILYDPRYHNAGWILEILAVGAVFFAMSASASSIMLAFGDSYRHMWLQFFRFGSVLLCMSCGGYLLGFTGLVWGATAAQMVYYPMLAFAARKYCRVDSFVDIVFMFCVLGTIAAVWLLRGWPGPAA